VLASPHKSTNRLRIRLSVAQLDLNLCPITCRKHDGEVSGLSLNGRVTARYDSSCGTANSINSRAPETSYAVHRALFAAPTHLARPSFNRSPHNSPLSKVSFSYPQPTFPHGIPNLSATVQTPLTSKTCLRYLLRLLGNNLDPVNLNFARFFREIDTYNSKRSLRR